MIDPKDDDETVDEHIERVAHTVEATLGRWDARKREEEAAEKAKDAKKERLTSRVSMAALALTMLMSFLGFARSEREGAAGAARGEAATAKADAEANWAYYQTRSAERADFLIADDTLARTTVVLHDDDPRLREAEVLHADYVHRIAAIDDENRQVFFTVQDLRRKEILASREADRIDRKVSRYDVGTRVLTLAIVLLSVALLARREILFWGGLAVASVGAAIAVNGYFLFL